MTNDNDNSDDVSLESPGTNHSFQDHMGYTQVCVLPSSSRLFSELHSEYRSLGWGGGGPEAYPASVAESGLSSENTHLILTLIQMADTPTLPRPLSAFSTSSEDSDSDPLSVRFGGGGGGMGGGGAFFKAPQVGPSL